MLVYPDSTIQFFKNIPLSPSGVDKVYYGTTADKDSAFSALFSGAYGSGQVAACTYQRENVNRVRVELPMATLYAVNYMRFRNASFENKWFYAFITEVNYINNVTTEVVYEIDYFTTWGGSFTPSHCYVERQHVEDDTIGKHVLEEGIPLGDYVTENTTSYMYGQLEIVISYVQTPNPEPGGGHVGPGIYSSALLEVSQTGIRIEEIINDLTERNLSQNVVQVFMCPEEFINYDRENKICKNKRFTKTVSKPYSNISGYVPKNNKLFVYPYKVLVADNLEGATQEYRYEWFNSLPPSASTGSCNFDITAIVLSNVEAMLAPVNYCGVSGRHDGVRLGQKDFPQCAYAVDTYKAYLAQQNAWLPQNLAQAEMERTVDTVASAAGGAVTGAMAGGVVGAITGGTLGAANSFIQGTANIEKMVQSNLIANQVRVQAPQEVHGATTGGVIAAGGAKGFVFYQKCIDADVARSIDDYFSMFGYKISENRVFNMQARQHWTYVQTVGCNVGGELPAADRAIINKMFDNGIRIWRRIQDVGNFNLSNNPV